MLHHPRYLPAVTHCPIVSSTGCEDEEREAKGGWTWRWRQERLEHQMSKMFTFANSSNTYILFRNYSWIKGALTTTCLYWRAYQAIRHIACGISGWVGCQAEGEDQCHFARWKGRWWTVMGNNTLWSCTRDQSRSRWQHSHRQSQQWVVGLGSSPRRRLLTQAAEVWWSGGTSCLLAQLSSHFRRSHGKMLRWKVVLWSTHWVRLLLWYVPWRWRRK